MKLVSCRWNGKFLVTLWLSTALILSSCSGRHHHHVEPAFYFWRSSFRLTIPELKYCDALEVRKLYVKFLDIDWDYSLCQPVPVSRTTLDTIGIQNLEIIPVVFVTNRTMELISADQINTLADNVFKNITRTLQPLHIAAVTELQVDCDWT